MQAERRRILRFQFSAPAELIDEASGASIKTRVTDISLYGCSLAVQKRLREGTPVRVQISTKTETFTSAASIVYSNVEGEIGVLFHDVDLQSVRVLHSWLVSAMQGRVPSVD